MPLQRRCQQAFGCSYVGWQVVVAFFMPFARYFADVQLLYGLRQGHYDIYPFEQSAGGFGVFADPVLQPRHVLQCA